MAAYDDRELYIPLRKSDLVALLCRELGDGSVEAEEFRQFARMLEATFHHEFHNQLEQLKDAYAPFDPDAETNELLKITPEDKQRRLNELIDRFVWLLERANFTHLSREELVQALKDGTQWGLKIDVDLNIFEKLEIFVRGESTVRRKRKRWANWYREEDYDVPVFRRLVVILRMRPNSRLPSNIDTENVYIKSFKDIPKMDLEMMLPGSRVRMTALDQGKVGVPLATGIGVTGYKLFTLGAAGLKLATTLGSMSSTIGLIALAGGTIGYGMRSFSGYQNTKRKYQLTLTESLYFHNLDNNAGVLFRLLDEAEEQENREALLAYFFLWREAGEQGWLPSALDDHIEQFLERAAGLKIDFEITDALEKVKRLGLVEELPDGRLRAIPILRALEALDFAWDSIFKYNTSDGPSTPALADAEP